MDKDEFVPFPAVPQVWVSMAWDNLCGWNILCWSFSSAGGKEDGEILMVNNLWFRLL